MKTVDSMNVDYRRKVSILPINIVLGCLLFTGQHFATLPTWGKELAPIQEVAQVEQRLRLEKLLRLINQRLLIAHDVARWKWNRKQPIEDRQREEELLGKLSQQANKYGLDGDTVTNFFQAQITASKLIQKADFQQWQQQGVTSFNDVADLNQTIRPALDQLNTEFLFVLAQLKPVLGCPAMKEIIKSRAEVIIRGNGINPTVQRLTIAPLLDVKAVSCH
jgi:chorismate mutase